MATVYRKKLTVAIPTRNRAPLLAKCIASVLEQSFTDFELLIVDSNSTDATSEVVKSFNDPRIRYVLDHDVVSMTENWNRCVELAEGELLCLFHDDDLMAPENLKAKVEALDANPQVGFVFSNAIAIDERDQLLEGAWAGISLGKTDRVYKRKALFPKLFGRNFVCAPSVVARTERIRQYDGFLTSLNFTADWQMWLKLSLFCEVAFLTEPLVKYRWHESNASNQFQGFRRLQQFFAARSTVLKHYPEEISFKALYWPWLLALYCRSALAVTLRMS